MFRKIFLIVIFVGVSTFSNVFAESKIAFIDLNYVFNNSSAGKLINKNIEDKTKKINSEFRDYSKKLDSQKEKLLAQKNVINKDEYQKKLSDIENNVNEYNQDIQKKNNDLRKYKEKARLEFTNKLRPILEKFAKDNSISVILKKENLLIGRSNLDATKNILDLFNKDIKKLKIE